MIVGKSLPVCLQEQFSYLRRHLDYFSIKEQTICPLPIGTIGYAVGVPIFTNWSSPFLQLVSEINTTMAPSLCRHWCFKGRLG